MKEYTITNYNLDLIRIEEVKKSIRYIKRTKRDLEFLTDYQKELKELEANTTEYALNNYFYNY